MPWTQWLNNSHLAAVTFWSSQRSQWNRWPVVISHTLYHNTIPAGCVVLSWYLCNCVQQCLSSLTQHLHICVTATEVQVCGRYEDQFYRCCIVIYAQILQSCVAASLLDMCAQRWSAWWWWLTVITLIEHICFEVKCVLGFYFLIILILIFFIYKACVHKSHTHSADVFLPMVRL